MPKQTRVLVVAALAATGSIVVACSSPRTTGEVDKTFAGKANASCSAALAKVSPNVFPYPSFDDTNPLVTQLPGAADFYDQEPFNHQEVGFVKTFGKPKEGTKTWQTFVGLVAKQQALVATEIKTGHAEDKPGFVAAAKAVEALGGQIKASAIAVGLGTSSSCILLFD